MISFKKDKIKTAVKVPSTIGKITQNICCIYSTGVAKYSQRDVYFNVTQNGIFQ